MGVLQLKIGVGDSGSIHNNKKIFKGHFMWEVWKVKGEIKKNKKKKK